MVTVLASLARRATRTGLAIAACLPFQPSPAPAGEATGPTVVALGVAPNVMARMGGGQGTFLLDGHPAAASVRAATCQPADGAAIRRLVHRVAVEEGFDPDLADAVAWVESRHGQDAGVSNAGALGIMQLMPETAEELGVSDRCDNEANVRGGIRYLRQLIGRFGDPILALAAYNAGPATIERAGGIPEFPETERYVVRVLNRWKYSAQLSPAQAAEAGSVEPNEAWRDGHVIEVE